MQRKSYGIRRVVPLIAALALAACSAQYRNHGYVPRDEDLGQIVPGIDTRATVEEVVGVPTSSGVLNESGFYYISSEMRQFAWRAPEVIDREVVAISFDGAGVVTNIERYGLEDGNVVPLSRRVTQSGGGDISFIRKLFGNIGRIGTEGLLGGS
ncbi:outer membrane protein assembly factor BamE [Roseivivax isoporae]|uniref:Outer membrane protein assembly factor BamE domain-containing protein n=1 Tax=Roseivivax isoporae LMG 25204 TaxID=1449351 RepID=X7FCV3_9RHOB|nr:outer membrane protein assembly factor BamE [Roseivivax isoporae]ETX30645.1 hypothetical protein RISW2_07465 [Roseivivax isoporae LMG 25204]